MSKFPKKKMIPLTEEELNAVTNQDQHQHLLIIIIWEYSLL